MQIKKLALIDPVLWDTLKTFADSKPVRSWSPMPGIKAKICSTIPETKLLDIDTIQINSVRSLAHCIVIVLRRN